MLAAARHYTTFSSVTLGVVGLRLPPVPAAHKKTSQLLAVLPFGPIASAMRNPLLLHAAAAERDATTDAAAAELTPRGNPVPPVVHAQAAATGRVICIGDIHGCLDEFRELLCKCRFKHSCDTLVLVGDLVNKGPHSAAVVAEARRLGALAVRGNHDDAALAAYLDHRAGRPVKDKHYWVKGLTTGDVEWLSALPFTLCLRDTLLVVHAGLVPGVPRTEQRLQDLYTEMLCRIKRLEMHVQMRDVVPRSGGGWEARTEHTSTGKAWAEVWGGPRHVLFGHDAQRRLQLRHFATGLDTGCVYGGLLTACVLPPASGDGIISKMKRLLGRCLAQGASSRQALTLHQLGGHIVSVPSRQTKTK